MKIIRCDVCEAEFEGEKEVIGAYIPYSYLLNEDDVEGLSVDVCSFACLSRIGREQQGLDDEMGLVDEVPEKKEPVGITPEQSELMTGVKMKY